MKRFRFEFILGAAMIAFVALVWKMQEPNRPLTPDETRRYLATVADTFPFPSDAEKADTLARLRRFAEGDDGRDFYMLNLLRFNEKMHVGPAHPAFNGSPTESNEFYEKKATPIALGSGSLPIFAGNVREPNVMGGAEGEDNWSRILVMHYPSRRHFFELVTDPRYLKIAAHKTYAMHVGLVPVERELVVPDVRFLAAAGALIVFLLIAWARALRMKIPGASQ